MKADSLAGSAHAAFQAALRQLGPGDTAYRELVSRYNDDSWRYDRMTNLDDRLLFSRYLQHYYSLDPGERAEFSDFTIWKKSKKVKEYLKYLKEEPDTGLFDSFLDWWAGLSPGDQANLGAVSFREN